MLFSMRLYYRVYITLLLFIFSEFPESADSFNHISVSWSNRDGSSLMAHMFGLPRSTFSSLSRANIKNLKFKNVAQKTLEEDIRNNMVIGDDDQLDFIKQQQNAHTVTYKMNDIVDGIILGVSQKAIFVDLGTKVISLRTLISCLLFNFICSCLMSC